MSFSSSSVCTRDAATTLSSDGTMRELLRKKSNMLAPAGNKFKLFAVFTIMSIATNFPEGYCNSYPNTAYKSFKKMLNDTYIKRGHEEGMSDNLYTWIWSTILNIWFAGYLVGTFLTPLLTDRFGRQKSLVLANIIALIGGILSFASTYFEVPELFFLSRVITSSSSGISFGAMILFLQEVTPTEMRGVTSFLCESTYILTMVIGVFFGMDDLFGQNLPLLTGIAIVPALIALGMVLTMHETPKFLLIQRGNRAAAMRSMEYYRGVHKENEIALEEIMVEKEMCDAEEKVSITTGVKEVFTQPHLRIAYLLGVAALQIIVAIWPIVYSSTDLLERDGVFDSETAQWTSSCFLLVNYIGSLFGMNIIDRFNRRPLFFLFGSLNILSLAGYVACKMLVTDVADVKWGMILSLMVYGFTYGMALGPIAYFISSELVQQRSRSIVQSLVFGTNTLANCLFSFVTMPIYNQFGVLSFVPLFLLPSCCCIVFTFKYLPETRGREVHEVVEELMIRHPSSSTVTTTGSSRRNSSMHRHVSRLTVSSSFRDSIRPIGMGDNNNVTRY